MEEIIVKEEVTDEPSLTAIKESEFNYEAKKEFSVSEQEHRFLSHDYQTFQDINCSDLNLNLKMEEVNVKEEVTNETSLSAIKEPTLNCQVKKEFSIFEQGDRFLGHDYQTFQDINCSDLNLNLKVEEVIIKEEITGELASNYKVKQEFYVSEQSDDMCNKLEPVISRELNIKNEDDWRTTHQTIKDFPQEKQFKCTVCAYTNIGAKSFVCDHQCGQKITLQQQIQTHTEEKLFKCALCDSKFGRKHHLQRHIQTHTGEKPFKCSLCDYKCGQKGTLDQHIRTHTGEKPFTCDICGCKCSQKSTLEQHIGTHTGEKSFKCSICDYKCRRKISLKLHVQTHTGEKPFKCNVCNYKCSVKYALMLHIRTHTKETPFECTVCEYKAARKSNLKRHMKTHI